MGRLAKDARARLVRERSARDAMIDEPVSTRPGGGGWRPRWPVVDWRRGARWFAAEFLVVVTGVLVALTIDAWWQGHTDIERERAWLRQLLVDFRANEQHIEDVVAREAAIVASASAVYRAAHAPGPAPPADSLRLWLFGALNLPSFQPRTATWDALIESGEIGLVRSDALRNRLIDYAGSMDYVQRRLEQLTATGLDGIRLILRRVDAYELGDERMRANRGLANLQSRFPTAWPALLSDLEFVSTVNTTGIAADGRSFEIGQLREPAHDIIRLLEEILAR